MNITKYFALSGLLLIALTTGCSSTGPLKTTIDQRFIETPKVATHLHPQPQTKVTERNTLIGLFADPDDTTDIRALDGTKGYIHAFQSEAKIVRLPALNRYVQSIVDKVLIQWPGEKPKVTVQISATDIPTAFANEFNEIVVSVGFLNSVETEDELAGIIGHELAHILLNHFERQSFFKSQKYVTSALRNLAISANQAENTKLSVDKDGKATAVTENEKEVAKKSRENTARAMLIDEISDTVFSAMWSRKNESEADLLGVDLATAAGYSPAGLVSSLDIMYLQEEAKVGRLKALKEVHEKELEELQKKGGAKAVLGYTKNILKDNAVAVWKETRDWVRRQHANPEKRMELIEEYYTQWYPDEYETRESNPTGKQSLARAARNANLKGAMNAIEDTHEALLALSLGDVNKAQNHAYKAITGPLANSHTTRTVMFLVRDMQGEQQRANALGNLRRISDHKVAPISVFDVSVREHLKDGQVSRANSFLSRGESRFGPNPMLPLRIAMAAETNKAEQAKEYFQKCKDVNVRQLTELCTYEMSLHADVVGKEYKKKGLIESIRDGASNVASSVKSQLEENPNAK